MAKSKHLSDTDRCSIEHDLSLRLSLKKIAAKLGKSTSTISREIRSRRISVDQYARHRIKNRCIHRLNCSISQLCLDKPNCLRRCSSCGMCNHICHDFREEICPLTDLPPYVCNGCTNLNTCVLRKFMYRHTLAHKNYRSILVEARSGANISEGELLALDEFISPLLLQGQSVHHIVSNNPDRFSVSRKSIYRYVAGGLLTARNIDLPRVSRLKPRKSKRIHHKVDALCRLGRSYSDYLAFTSDGTSSVVEMDSVIGRIGGKCLLTMVFRSCDLLLAFIRDNNNSQSVIDVFMNLYRTLGRARFLSLFPVILTDNGSEFSNPLALEFDPSGAPRTRLFYCDPGAAYQKPHIERSHEILRRILSKGASFDHLSQKDINLTLSHINSYSRAKLADKTPYELFAFLYGSEILDLLGLHLIPPNNIVLHPNLLSIAPSTPS